MNHSQKGEGRFVNPTTGANTQTIEGSWKWMKHKLEHGGYLGDNMALHMCEFLWRKMIRTKKMDAFEHLIECIKSQYVPDYMP